jgi:hypothetical protein
MSPNKPIPDRPALVLELLDALVLALPYVTDAEGFPEQFKPGVVRKHVAQIRAAIAAAEGAIA